MIRISARYAGALTALLGLALVPVLANTFDARARDSCSDPAALHEPPAPRGMEEWIERDKSSDGFFQWTEARAQTPGKGRIRVYVVRTFSPTPLALRPTIFVGAQNEIYDSSVEWLDSGEDRLPITMRRAESDQNVFLVASLFVYAGRPVANPMRSVLSASLARLWSGARPVTLYWVDGWAPKSESAHLERRSLRWLKKAWQRHRDVCASAVEPLRVVAAGIPKGP